MLKRWSEFRRKQRELMRASRASKAPREQEAAPTEQESPPNGQGEGAETGEHPRRDLMTGVLPLQPYSPRPRRSRDYGIAGLPLNQQSPFYVGFVGAFGVLVAYALYRALGQLTQVLTLLVVAFFMTLSLNPLVEALCKRGMVDRCPLRPSSPVWSPCS